MTVEVKLPMLRLNSASARVDFSWIWPSLFDLDDCRSNYTPQVAFIDDGNVVPGTGNIIVNGREFFLESDEISSFGTDIVLSASHRYRRKKPFNVDGARTSFEWQSQASLSSNLYTETSDFNLNIISADTGPSFISAGRWLGAIPFRIDYVNLGQSSLATALSVNPYISFDLGNYRSIMIESTSDRLCEKGMPHYGSPDKVPAVRLQTLADAGKAKIPFTTGILIGIGRHRSRRAARRRE